MTTSGNSAQNIICSLHRTARWKGAYVLHLCFDTPARLKVGRFQHGQPLHFDCGHYLYVGSAMGRNAGLHLPKRLVRHATRSGDLPPHRFRNALLAHFDNHGLSAQRVLARAPKRLFWNIDFVLDHCAANLLDVFYIRSDQRLEGAILRFLESRSDTMAPWPGFGAHDDPGHSHLLRLTGGYESWDDCCRALNATLG